MSAKRNNAFNALPQFIWGEAVSEAGFTPQDYLIHTRYPRFIASVYESHAEDFTIRGFKSELRRHPQTGQLVYVSDFGLGLKDWVFFDSGAPDLDNLKTVCDLAVINYMMRDYEYGINDE